MPWQPTWGERAGREKQELTYRESMLVPSGAGVPVWAGRTFWRGWGELRAMGALTALRRTVKMTTRVSAGWPALSDPKRTEHRPPQTPEQEAIFCCPSKGR